MSRVSYPAPSGRAGTLTGLRRLAFRHRRLLAAGLVGIAALAIVAALRPPTPVTAPVLVAVVDLPAGSTVTADDVSVQSIPVTYAPPEAFSSPDEVTDRVLVGPVRAGEVMTPTRLVGGDPLPGTTAGSSASMLRPAQATGLVAAPVRIADAGAVALLSPGDVVDVIAARGGGMDAATATVVARSVRVLTIPRRRAGEGGFLSSGASDLSAGADGALVVLAVPLTTSVDLARATASGRLSVVLHAA